MDWAVVTLIGGPGGGKIIGVRCGSELPEIVTHQEETYVRFGRTSCYVHSSKREAFHGSNQLPGVRQQERTRPPHLRPVS
jgi:hypothetical protein